ncbi:MAG: hypothetical protein AB8B83_05410 [Bdellovibrionales bacterium]
MFFTNFTDNQFQRLIQLPYRAGLYVSVSDDVGGEQASENEIRALENLIYGFSDGVFGSELVQHVMSETIKHKHEWKGWHDDLDKVPNECEDALAILAGHFDQKERNAYATRILSLGEAVALAFRENVEAQSGFARFKAYLHYMKCNKIAKKKSLPQKTFDDFLSISKDERLALEALATSLNLEYI